MMTIWRAFRESAERRRRPDPSAGLGDLEAALARPDCPICARSFGADERWLDHFLYEGYLEPEAVRALRRGAGFCAHHAARAEAVGTSAAVALVYLSLIDDALARLPARTDRPRKPLIEAAGFCAACAQLHAAERREAFFLALLLRSGGQHRYGNPAVVCMPHLPRLAERLDAAALGDTVAAQHRTLADLQQEITAGQAASACDRALRIILGASPAPAERRRPEERAGCADDSDPVRRLRRRLRDLPSCAICAEIGDASCEWLDWLARAAGSDGDLSDVLPLCRRHVWQTRELAGPAVALALAENTLREAADTLASLSQRPVAPPLVQFFRRAPGPDLLARGRECPLCRREREAGERAILLLSALLEDPGARRDFGVGFGLCVRHASQALRQALSPAVTDIIAATTRARLLLLRWELEEQLRRGAWRARPERRGAESAAWLRAGARFAGTLPTSGRGT
jgi:hypothetical protein